MDWSRVQEVLIICIPVFAMVGLGKVLERRGVLNEDHRHFANWLTYNFALPALIFNGVAQQRFIELINIPLLMGPLAAIVLVTGIFMLLARLLGVQGPLAAAFVFGTFWANVTYMGFPLASNAYGTQGMSLAAVYNAVIMPIFLIMAFTLIGFYGGSAAGTFRERVRKTLLNPIVLAAIAGIFVAFAGESVRDNAGNVQLPASALALCDIIESFLSLVGNMGLPLALLAVGASMHLSEIRNRIGLLALVLMGKLVLLPLLTLLIIRVCFPQADAAALGVAVMLGATPNAVASFVVSRQMGVEEGFVSSMLVISTGLSVITLPVWLYVIL